MLLDLAVVRRSILGSMGLVLACNHSQGAAGDDAGATGSTGGGSSGASSGSGSGSTGSPGGSAGDPGAPKHRPDHAAFPCMSSTPIMQAGMDASMPTGYEACDDGRIHRVEAVECQDPHPGGEQCTMNGAVQDCYSDSDCTAASYGRCVQDSSCHCVYGCATDSDCKNDGLCVCGGDADGYPQTTTCISGTCNGDAACDGDFMCVFGYPCGADFLPVLACQGPQDECAPTTVCPRDPDLCFAWDGQPWNCQYQCCGCGRPLLVDGQPVVATVVTRDDWGGADAVAVEELPEGVRRRLAESWAAVAQLEHASVASFARFSLDLMGLGAPPSLLEATQRAALDEIDHARRCFALASRYAGTPVGPGPLAISGAVAAASREAVIEAVIEEACVSETLAAIEARAACAMASDPQVRATLQVIADDELRHAELGWQTLRWALDQVDADTRTRLLAHLTAAIDRADASRPDPIVDPARDHLRAHGLLDDADRRAVLRDALAQVLRPCAAAFGKNDPGSRKTRTRSSGHRSS